MKTTFNFHKHGIKATAIPGFSSTVYTAAYTLEAIEPKEQFAGGAAERHWFPMKQMIHSAAQDRITQQKKIMLRWEASPQKVAWQNVFESDLTNTAITTQESSPPTESMSTSEETETSVPRPKKRRRLTKEEKFLRAIKQHERFLRLYQQKPSIAMPSESFPPGSMGFVTAYEREQEEAKARRRRKWEEKHAAVAAEALKAQEEAAASHFDILERHTSIVHSSVTTAGTDIANDEAFSAPDASSAIWSTFDPRSLSRHSKPLRPTGLTIFDDASDPTTKPDKQLERKPQHPRLRLLMPTQSKIRRAASQPGPICSNVDPRFLSRHSKPLRPTGFTVFDDASDPSTKPDEQPTYNPQHPRLRLLMPTQLKTRPTDSQPGDPSLQTDADNADVMLAAWGQRHGLEGERTYIEQEGDRKRPADFDASDENSKRARTDSSPQPKLREARTRKVPARYRD
ncbi:uncharacterized protein AB675_2209 [Cyphellophora attinorum]|uniref:Uncharacterized protein n=1 Tax=Cyphellophora attinorum TaxID=1664694 RepID=A0A0N0NPM2_9EURO|nr:uncharacterized protein AB675_2209 [Phialophora attinorum]KPI42709.1 hypothetical protein AB675_2209 [Phialophora attinorum]